MKHYFTLPILLLVIGAGSIQAKRITISQAQKQAYSFWNKQMPQRTQSKMRRANTSGLLSDDEVVLNEPYYVFNNDDGGFIIIAGDDAVSPVLGYSKSGSFDADRIPDGLKDLLANYRKQIVSLSDDAKSVADSYNSSVSAYAGEKLLHTATWNQGAPFNKYVPNQYPVGCVATAGAIVMKYHGYPQRGTGSHSYTWNGQTLNADFEHEYDWNGMPSSYTYGSADALYEDVARLMSDLGVAVEMQYAKGGSSASTSKLLEALKTYFGYSKYAKQLSADYYSQDEWMKKLRGEIDANRPVLYSAQDASAGGHTFVLDGYRDDAFYVNWGWGGYCDGFYVIGALNPENGGKPSGEKFNTNQSAVFNLQPSDGKEVIPGLVIANMQNCMNGTNMGTTDVKANQRFMFIAGPLMSQAENGSFAGEVAVVLKDSKGNTRSKLASVTLKELQKNSYYPSYDFTCTSSVDAVEGDYLALVCKENGASDYLEVKNFDDSDMHIPATGYTPQTAEIIKNVGEGARIDESPTYKLYFYDGKLLVGADYYFKVQYDDGIVKAFVEVDGKEPGKVTNNDGTVNYYYIGNILKPSYQLRVLTYRKYQEMACEVNLEMPGQLAADILRNGYDDYQYTTIKVRGDIDKRDLEALDSESHFKTIDLGECRIVAYGDSPADAIPDGTFWNNKGLQHFVMPMGITTLGTDAFRESGLVEISLPETITSFGLNTFWGCYQLADVYMYHKEAPYWISWCVFSNKGSQVTRTLHLQKGSKEKYLNYAATQNWIVKFDDVVEDLDTGISSVAADNNGGQAVIYDLNGRLMPTIDSSRKGIYIVNGKKVIR